MHTTPHPAAGQTIAIVPAAALFGRTDTTPIEFHIEDWNDRVFGQSWMYMGGHPAALNYAVRSAVGPLPLDNEVVYGKDDRGLGHLVHISEIKDSAL